MVSSNGLYYEYHPRISIKEWNRLQQFPPLYKGSIEDFPAEISKKITLVKGTIVIAMTTGRKTSPVKTVSPDKFIRTGFNGRNWNIRGMSFMR